MISSRSPELPSNQRFGWFFSGLSVIGAVYFHGKGLQVGPAVLALLAVWFAAASMAAPGLLAPLNRLWYELGLLLGRIVSPVVLGALFFLLVTPVSLITRLLGRDELLIKRRRVASYWIDRDVPGPAPESFKNQF